MGLSPAGEYFVGVFSNEARGRLLSEYELYGGFLPHDVRWQ